MTTEDHTRGPVSCDQVGMFVDGELDAERAETFRQHLVHCARCQSEMHALLQLAGLAEEAAAEKPREQHVPHPAFIPRRAVWKGIGGMVALAVTAAIAFVVVQSQRPTTAAELLASRTARRVSGWPSYAGAREYLPYVVQRGNQADDIVPGVAKLEERQDWAGLASVALVRGEFRQAVAYLQRAPKDARTQNDIGLALLELGQLEAALEAFDAAIAADPTLLQPHFNRALALQRLGLPRAALQSLQGVTTQARGGWQAETEALIRALEDQISRATTQANALGDARKALIEAQVVPSSEWISSAPGTVRRAFYSAVAAASDDRALARLEPLARELDKAGQASTLQELLAQVRAHANAERWRVASDIATLLRNPGAAKPADLRALAERAHRAGQSDQQLLIASQQFLDETLGFPALARASGDPFWKLRLLAREARVAGRNGTGGSVQPRIEGELPSLCKDPSLSGECSNVFIELALLRLRVGQPELALRALDTAAVQARQAPEPTRDRGLLLIRGDVNVQADRMAAARGTFEDVLAATPGDCGTSIYVANLLTMGFVARGDASNARKSFRIPPACLGFTAYDTVYRGRVATELAVLENSPEARARAEQELSRVDAASLGPQKRQDVALARVTLLAESDDPRAEAELEAAIRAGRAIEESGSDDDLSYARTSLVFWALRRGAPEKALQLVADLNGAALPPTCVLGAISRYARQAWIARGPSGAFGSLTETGPSPTRRTPASLEQQLASCSTVSVMANASMLGTPGLLASSFAWSFVTGAAPSAGSTRWPRKLRVRGVLPPAELELPAVGDRGGPEDAGWTLLQGAAATPDAVKRALPDADLIDFEVHGIVRAEMPDGALLALSSSAEGYALTASAVEATSLPKAPVVLLGACRAAVGSPFRSRPWNLPLSFRRAGARAVFASISELPDDRIGEFFAGLLARMEAGSTPRVALRDERQAWITRGQTWVDDVVLFDASSS